MNDSLRQLTFLGTDTEVGKTYQACALARELTRRGKQVGVYKPVASGSSEEDLGDAARLRDAAQFKGPIEQVCPQSFSAAVAPPIAAELVGRRVDEELLVAGVESWQGIDCLLVETAGGVLSPISDHLTSADLAQRLQFPVILVVPNRLGMVNQTLMAVEAIRSRNLRLVGVLVNSWSERVPDASLPTNLKLLRQFCSEEIFETAEQVADLF